MFLDGSGRSRPTGTSIFNLQCLRLLLAVLSHPARFNQIDSYRPKADTKQNKKTTPKSGWHALTDYVVLKRITRANSHLISIKTGKVIAYDSRSARSYTSISVTKNTLSQ